MTDDEGAASTTKETSQEEPKKRGLADIMSEIFLPMLPALIGAGILQGMVSLFVAFGWLTEGQPLHTLLSTASSAIFYFLPFLIAATSAKAFNTSPYLAMAVVAFFVYPDMVDLMAGDAEISLFGIPIVKTTYTSSVIPIILIIWGMSYVHRFAQRVTPKMLQTVLVPPITIAFTCLVGLLVFGPIGAGLTEAISWVVNNIQDLAPWLVPLVVGMFGAILVSIGMSFALFPIALTTMNEQGWDSVYGPGMLASNMALAGMALAVALALKAKDTDYKAFSSTASVTALLGVAQPAVYGVALALRKPFIGVMSGGAAGGLVAGLTGFQVYGLSPAGLAAIPVYVGDEGFGNLFLGFAVMVTAFAVAFVVTWLLGFEDLSREQVEEVVGENAT
ncbi:PTS transporter subunit EIIC [Janibacter indicus]|uniref:PTS transporter subunit EIIC n=1 Tax=Janibacter indicus TaxID=857417 RepID=UPI003EB9CA93